MSVIRHLRGLEILDSRGRPTVQVTCELSTGGVGTVSVPSGASTGGAEAQELRDKDPNRYKGYGCKQAVHNIHEALQNALVGRPFKDQIELDQAMIELDGTPNKARLGANAILAVSLAYARAVANERRVPLYEYFSSLLQVQPRLPRPTINLFSGGKHAGGQVVVQDVLVVPLSAETISEVLEMTFSVYQAAAELIYKKYNMRALTADEGGLAPAFPGGDAMLADAVEAIEAAGLKPGEDVALAIDVASSHFYRDGAYYFGERALTSEEMIAQLLDWLERYPLISIEDGLAEEDWSHWPHLRERVAGRALVVGDDLLCTNSARIRRAQQVNAADTLLLKVNQIGTVSEAAEACRLARAAGWSVTVSARSGETEDNWLADLATGWRGDQIKVGSITQSERLAKYNRLLAIEAETGLPLAGWPGR